MKKYNLSSIMKAAWGIFRKGVVNVLGNGVVIDCEIPIDDKVLPMVAPGASINDMMGFIDNENP